MNEQIRQLALQSDATVLGTISGGKQYTFLEQDLARFAELIVRECVDIVDDAKRGGDNEVWDNAVNFVRRDLKEHFGVDNDPPNYEADEGPLSEKQVEQVQQGAWMFQSSLFLKDE